MKVLEIKNNLVKIAYDVKDNLALSNFVIIEDTNTPYVAQVVNIKADSTTNFAIVKLLFTFNEEGILKNYNGTIPSTKANVSILPSNELLDIIPIEDPIRMGQLAQQNVELKVDKTIFDNNLLICSNNLENTSTLLNNILKQLKNKVVIFDTDGQFDWENKLYFGKEFKLPLNYDTINFIYDTELEDVDATSKAIIQDIFIEVQEYTKTLPEGYLPFETFLNVVDQQYKETQITELVLLKNKLLKYRDLNVFAETLKDVLNLSIAIEKSDITVIDISDMPHTLQKEIMSYTYNIMNSIKSDIYSFVKIDNSNTDKKLLKKFLVRSNVYTTIICSHEYKYLPEIKEAAQNLILFAPLTLQHDFASYNTFLNKLNSDEFIIYGAHTQNIPLIVELDDIEIDENTEDDLKKQDTQTDNIVPMPEIKPSSKEEKEKEEDEIIEENTIEEEEINSETNENSLEMPEVEYPDITIDEIPIEQNNNQTEETEIISVNEDIQLNNEIAPVDNILSIEEELPTEPTIIENNSSTNNPENIIIEDSPIEITTEEPNTQNENLEIYNSENNIEEIEEDEIEPQIELQEPEIDYSVEDIDIEENFGEPQIIENNDDLIEQVAKDVDKAFYEKLPDENYELPDNDNIETDELTEDDLNLIDDLAIDDTNMQLDNSFQESENIEQTPVVPIYETEDLEPKENQKLEPGDRVSTPKYGEGIVEKMIKYGNKMLCSIEFPNIGRRLLDPAMSEIIKLD
ncbi:unknown [Clostridium sp. CAG:768]|nr:unknown [Clostridium sp. CAG:768]